MTAYESDNLNNDPLEPYVDALATLNVPDGPAREVDAALDQRLAEMQDRDARSSGPWRIWTMKITQIAAALVLVACLAVGLVLSLGGSTPAFAEIHQAIINAQSVSCIGTIKFTDPQPNQPDKMTLKMTILKSGSMRQEMTIPDPKTKKAIEIINITNIAEGKMLMLMPGEKTATLLNMDEMNGGQAPTNVIEEFKKIGDKLDDEACKLVDKEERDGRETLVYEIAPMPDKVPEGVNFPKDLRIKLWVDSETKLPVEIAVDLPAPIGMNVNLNQFTWDDSVDLAKFSVEIPEGYKSHSMDLSGSTENDLADSLKIWTELADGKFPDTYDNGAMQQLFKDLASSDKPKPDDEEILKISQRLTRGLIFAAQHFEGGKFHYVGKGKTTADTDQVIVYWVDKESGKYRAMLGDFGLKELAEDDLPK